MDESYGMMVNYRYDLTALDRNNQLYLIHQQVVAAERVTNLLKNTQ